MAGRAASLVTFDCVHVTARSAYRATLHGLTVHGHSIADSTTDKFC